jgi:hypothetical protein
MTHGCIRVDKECHKADSVKVSTQITFYFIQLFQSHNLPSLQHCAYSSWQPAFILQAIVTNMTFHTPADQTACLN